MIFDDTVLTKTGKNIEKVSRVFDHVTQRYVNGFKQRLDQRLWGLFIELMQIIVVLFEDIDEQELLEKILQAEES